MENVTKGVNQLLLSDAVMAMVGFSKPLQPKMQEKAGIKKEWNLEKL